MSGGYEEPLYLPRNSSMNSKNQIRYTQDYASSALHEAAHWCLAGKARRKCIDYGYLYEPPPRNETSQRRFELHELDVQAMEFLFSEGANVVFKVSLDDLNTTKEKAESFQVRVEKRATVWQLSGLPPRVVLFQDGLLWHMRRKFVEMSSG